MSHWSRAAPLWPAPSGVLQLQDLAQMQLAVAAVARTQSRAVRRVERRVGAWKSNSKPEICQSAKCGSAELVVLSARISFCCGLFAARTTHNLLRSSSILCCFGADHAVPQ